MDLDRGDVWQFPMSCLVGDGRDSVSEWIGGGDMEKGGQVSVYVRSWCFSEMELEIRFQKVNIDLTQVVGGGAGL